MVCKKVVAMLMSLFVLMLVGFMNAQWAGAASSKEALFKSFNYAVPEKTHPTSDARLWKVAQLEAVKPAPMPASKDTVASPAASVAPAVPAPAQEKKAPAVKKTTSWEGMTWENNSKEMFEKSLDMTPFFVRSVAKGRIMDGITAKAGEKKIVSEETVMLSVKESAEGSHTDPILVELEKMRTK